MESRPAINGQSTSFEEMNNAIVRCTKCPRLVTFRKEISIKKRKQYSNFEYWGRPITGYGDPAARLVVIGLAPAAHGGNRTGRVFTGDNSAKFLVKHLYLAGFASQPTSETRNDGLSYIDCYVTAAVRCVPPDNKPTVQEIQNCSSYLAREFHLLKNAKAVLALGKVAFDAYLGFVRERYDIKRVAHIFRHGTATVIADGLPVVFSSYHPSPRNTNTGKLTSEMFLKVLGSITSYLKSSEGSR